MYSEIKSSEQILINRLDENERIILEDIYKKSKQEDTEISLEKLTDESGDFGGVLVDFKTNDIKHIELTTEIPETESIYVGGRISIPINTNVTDVPLVVYGGLDNNDNIEADITENSIILIGNSVTDETAKLYYSMSAEGYQTVNGTININITRKEVQPVEYRVLSGSDNITYACSIELLDENDTQYILTYDGTKEAYCTNLPKGNYTANVSYNSSGAYIDTVYTTIDDEIMENPNPLQIDVHLPVV